MGAPVGNTNAAKAKRWTAAIERALERFPQPADPEGRNELMQGLDRAADLFVAEMMEKKDLGFFREFGNRVEGCPKQIIAGDEDAPLQTRSIVEVLFKTP